MVKHFNTMLYVPTMFTISESETDRIITLNDGRKLGYELYGDLEGYPVFYFHGGQESRLSAAFMDGTARKLKICIIAPDRPGVGLSYYHPGRRFIDWASDVNALADALEIDKFSVFGLSGGSPHVLACAHEIPHRIHKVGIVSGTAPYNYRGKLKGVWLPLKLLHWIASFQNHKSLQSFMEREAEIVLERPEKRIKQLQKFLPKPDRSLMKFRPEYAECFIRGSQESFHKGINAAVQEWQLYVRDWGFELSNIEKQVLLWYGAKDKMAPKYKGMYLKEQLPEAELYILENEGHFSLIRNHLHTILSQLLP